MSHPSPSVDAQGGNDRAAWTLDAGLAAFAATTGALLVFAYSRGGTLAPFAQVGRRVARDIPLPAWGDAAVGLSVHFGESLVLGGLTALLLSVGRAPARIRSALIVVLAWELSAVLAPLAVIRADVAAELPMVSRVGLALLLVAALAIGPRAPRARA